MSDSISRQDAIELAEKVNGNMTWADRDELIKQLKALPSTDAVEVVRCKDCKHRHEEDECPMYFVEQIDIDEGDGYYDTDYIFHDYTQDDGWCSWGERE